MANTRGTFCAQYGPLTLDKVEACLIYDMPFMSAFNNCCALKALNIFFNFIWRGSKITLFYILLLLWAESNFRFLSLRFQIKNFCIFVLNWFWPKYGNRLKLHELSNDLSKGESQGGSTLPREDWHSAGRINTTEGGWTLRREDQRYGRKIDTLQGGLTLPREDQRYGGRMDTLEEKSTLRRENQHSWRKHQ